MEHEREIQGCEIKKMRTYCQIKAWVKEKKFFERIC